MKNKKQLSLPTTKELETELRRVKYKFRYKKIFNSTIYTLLIVSAFSIIIATYILPVLQIYGKSMEPTLTEKDIVISIKKENLKKGDIIAFYYNNKILIKRIVATSLDWINIDKEGNIFVNDKLLEEPYIKNKYLGETNLEYPYQVKENSYFVLGDARDNSIDSRNSKIGTISKDKIIGKIVFKVWPIKNFGIIN